MVRKIEKDFLLADLSTVESLLLQATDEDILSVINLKGRQEELRQQLNEIEYRHEPYASSAIFFSGSPVVGNRGIASEFGGKAIALYQDIVSKVFVVRSQDSLSQRGVVPSKELSKLHITNIVRGSFGFQFEELDGQLFTTPLRESMEQAADIIEAFAAEDDDTFSQIAANIDERALSTINDFFRLMKDSQATFRIVTGDQDKKFDKNAVERAVERWSATRISEYPDTFHGRLRGVLPDYGDFNYIADANDRVIRGKLAKTFPISDLEELNRMWVGIKSVIDVTVRRVYRGENLKSESFILNDIRMA